MENKIPTSKFSEYAEIQNEFHSLLSDSRDLSINELEIKQRKLGYLLTRHSQMVNRTLGVLIPGFLLITVYGLVGVWQLLRLTDAASDTLVAFSILLSCLVFLVIIGACFLYFRYGTLSKKLQSELKRAEEESQIKELESLDTRTLYYRREYRRLVNKSAKAFFENQERAIRAAAWRKSIGRRLDSKDIAELNEVQYLLTALNELILTEENEKRQQRNWQNIALLITLIFIGGLATAAYFLGETSSNAPAPIFGIPVSVLIWGATGSLAAILYRFYTEKQRIRFTIELRWLIARPIIGIIEGVTTCRKRE
jgi:hypothetical protein